MQALAANFDTHWWSVREFVVMTTYSEMMQSPGAQEIVRRFEARTEEEMQILKDANIPEIFDPSLLKEQISAPVQN